MAAAEREITRVQNTADGLESSQPMPREGGEEARTMPYDPALDTMTPQRYVNETYPGPITIPVLDKTAKASCECDWASCSRPAFTIQAGEGYVEWKGIAFCADCWNR